MLVQKLNVVKEIEERELDYYIDKGFREVDKDGNLVEAESGADEKLSELEAAVKAQKKEIAELKKALAEAEKKAKTESGTK